MRDVTCTGTGGDTLITALKLRTLPQQLHVHHCIEGKDFPQWHGMIESIYEYAAPNVRQVSFGPLQDYPRIYSYPDTSRDEVEEIGMHFFPSHLTHDDVGCRWYEVVIANAGKPLGSGRNTKRLTKKIIYDRVRSSTCHTYVLGTDPEYRSLEIHPEDGTNLVGKTDVREALAYCYGAHWCTGPVGLLVFAALAGRTPCHLFFVDPPEITKRISNTPWEEYVARTDFCQRNGLQYLGHAYERDIARRQSLYGRK